MAKDKGKDKKRIVKAKIDFISLCPRGANTFNTLYKADGDTTDVELSFISKHELTEQGELIACMYAPELEDSQGDIASEAVIKEFAHDFQKRGSGIDIKHNEVALSKDDIYVAESFIVQKGDPRFAEMTDYDGNSVDVTGGWGVVLNIDSDDLRNKYKSGDWAGVSMGGMAVKKSDSLGDANVIVKFFKDIIGNNGNNKISKKNTENNMALNDQDKKDVAELVVKTMAEVTKKADEAAAEKLKKALEYKPKLGLGYAKPILPDGPTPEQMTKFSKNIAMWDLSEKVDPEDQMAIHKFREAAAELATSKDLGETLRKQAQNPFESFYKTNQGNQQIPGNGSADDIVIALKKANDEADKEAANQ